MSLHIEFIQKIQSRKDKMHFVGFSIDLNAQLAESGVGCNIGGTYFNNLSYVDHMVLLFPTVKSLRKLLSICQDVAAEHDITYNMKKTEHMLFRPSVTMDISSTVKLTGVDYNFLQRFV